MSDREDRKILKIPTYATGRLTKRLYESVVECERVEVDHCLCDRWVDSVGRETYDVDRTAGCR